MKKRTSAKRKNPPPQFHIQIKNLIGKTVTVQFGSENGVFSITDKLIEEGFNNYKLSLDIDKPNPSNTKITFNLFLIERIIGNTIVLMSAKNFVYDKTWILKWSDLAGERFKAVLISMLTTQQNIINLNSNFFISTGLPFPEVRCKLTYDKNKDLFYYSKLHKFFLNFKSTAIVGTKFREVFVDI